MAAEEFFARWAKKRQEAQTPADTLTDAESPVGEQRVTQTPQVSQSPQDRQQDHHEAQQLPKLPTMEDVSRLTHDSDYSPFMAKGVDEAVKRSAMKKLFSDPHFNVMDGLDVYIEDFTKFEPITPAMLASLEHAKELLNPKAGKQALMRLLDPASEQKDQPAGAAALDGVTQAQSEQAHDTQAQNPDDASRQITDTGTADPPNKDEAAHATGQDAAARKADDN